jgi:hypothetical protein
MTWALAAVLLAVFPGRAHAQLGCTPVVYAFRHAEDNSDTFPYPRTLTDAGGRHADLYVPMMNEINTVLKTTHCPVTKVYAINLTKADGTGNTTNPFYTAQPLAVSRMRGSDPLVAVRSRSATYALLEFLGNSPEGSTFVPSYTTAPAAALRGELVATAQAAQSSAIFWTSQGLHILAGAIIGADSKVPQKAIKGVTFPAGTQAGTPPRNAVYIFPYDAAKAGFSDVTEFNAYVQCYNWTMKSPDADTAFRADFWCGNSNYGDLGGNPNYPSLISKADLACVHARICKTKGLSSPGSAYYGSCPSGMPKVVPPC